MVICPPYVLGLEIFEYMHFRSTRLPAHLKRTGLEQQDYRYYYCRCVTVLESNYIALESGFPVLLPFLFSFGRVLSVDGLSGYELI